MSARENPSVAYTLEMDEYEVANLREGLLFLRAVGGDTGDWMGQLLMKLPEVERKPNATCQEQRRSAATGRVPWEAATQRTVGNVSSAACSHGKGSWYFVSRWVCVLCGSTTEYRERRWTEKPTDPAERQEYIEEACGVHFC